MADKGEAPSAATAALEAKLTSRITELMADITEGRSHDLSMGLHNEGAGNPACWMNKSGAGGLFRSYGMSRRWVVLDGMQLGYFKASSTSAKEQGSVHLGSVNEVQLVIPQKAVGGGGDEEEEEKNKGDEDTPQNARFVLATDNRNYMFEVEVGGEDGRGRDMSKELKDYDQHELTCRWIALFKLVLDRRHNPRRSTIGSRGTGSAKAGASSSSAAAAAATGGGSSAAGAADAQGAAAVYEVTFDSGPLYMDLQVDPESDAVQVVGFTTPPTAATATTDAEDDEEAAPAAGPAEASGKIKPGDSVVGVNGEDFEEKNTSSAHIIKSLMRAPYPKAIRFRQGERDANALQASGWMHKCGIYGSGGRRRRYFKLRGTSLEYYKPADNITGSSSMCSTKMAGAIDLADVTEIKPIYDLNEVSPGGAGAAAGDVDKQLPYRLELVTPKRTWILVPADLPSLKYWVQHLRAANTEATVADLKTIAKQAGGSGGSSGSFLGRGKKSKAAAAASAAAAGTSGSGGADGGGGSGEDQLPPIAKSGWVMRVDDFNAACHLRRFAVVSGTSIYFLREPVDNPISLRDAVEAGTAAAVDLSSMRTVAFFEDESAAAAGRADEIYGLRVVTMLGAAGAAGGDVGPDEDALKKHRYEVPFYVSNEEDRQAYSDVIWKAAGVDMSNPSEAKDALAAADEEKAGQEKAAAADATDAAATAADEEQQGDGDDGDEQVDGHDKKGGEDDEADEAKAQAEEEQEEDPEMIKGWTIGENYAMGWVWKRGDIENKGVKGALTALSGSVSGEFRRRWFVLYKDELSYYKWRVKEPSAARVGTIDMKKVLEVRRSLVGGVGALENAIDIVTTTRIYTIRPTGGDDGHKAWVSLLRRSADVFSTAQDEMQEIVDTAKAEAEEKRKAEEAEAKRREEYLADLVKHGRVHKAGARGHKLFSTRYLALSADALSLHKSYDDMLNGDKDPIGTLQTSIISSIKSDSGEGKEKPEHPFTFQVFTTKRTWTLAAETEEAMVAWMKAICGATYGLKLERKDGPVRDGPNAASVWFTVNEKAQLKSRMAFYTGGPGGRGSLKRMSSKRLGRQASTLHRRQTSTDSNKSSGSGGGGGGGGVLDPIGAGGSLDPRLAGMRIDTAAQISEEGVRSSKQSPVPSGVARKRPSWLARQGSSLVALGRGKGKGGKDEDGGGGDAGGAIEEGREKAESTVDLDGVNPMAPAAAAGEGGKDTDAETRASSTTGAAASAAVSKVAGGLKSLSRGLSKRASGINFGIGGKSSSSSKDKDKDKKDSVDFNENPLAPGMGVL